MVKKAVAIIAVAIVIVNGKVIQTLEAERFNRADTPSRGTKIRAVSFEINARDHKPARIASSFTEIETKVFYCLSLIANSGKPSDSKLTSILRYKY